MQDINLENLLFQPDYAPEVGIRKREDVVGKMFNAKGPRHISVIDCDEVLFNISDKWYKKLSEFKNFIEILSEGSANDLKTIIDNSIGNLRLKYDMLEALDVKPSQELREFFNNLYFQDSSFYDDIQPTRFFNSIDTILSQTDIMSEIHILSKVGRSKDLPVNKSKLKRLKEIFKLNSRNTKVEFHFIEENKSKAEYLNEKHINFDLFVDDSSANIIDCILNSKAVNYEILVPAYGYNTHFLFPEKEIVDAMKSSNITLSYFHNLENVSPEKFSDYMQGIIPILYPDIGKNNEY